jgi:hypothetical protein
MTSDGIADADWDRVHELAVAIVNASAREDEEGEARARVTLFTVLDQLDDKYGPKPSLLATRADYVESPEHREWLLRAAYTQAASRDDYKNQLLIAHSLAEFFIEEVVNLEEGAVWLATWREHLGVAPVENDGAELARLEALLLRGGAA